MLKALDNPSRAGAVPEAMIGDIYSTIVDESSLQGLVDILHRAHPDSAVLLYGQDVSSLPGNYLIHRGLKRDAERAYMTGLRLDDPFILRQWHEPVGHIYDERAFLADDIYSRSLFHREFLSVQTPLESVMGAVMSRYGAKQQVIEVRFDRADPQARKSVHHMLEVLMPHIVRAFSLARERHMHPLEGSGGDDLLEFIPVAAFALDANCVVRARNDIGEAMLRHMGCVMRGADGVLHARDAKMDEQIKVFASAAGSEYRRANRNLFASKTEDGSRLFVSMHAVPPPDTRNIPGSGFYAGDGWRSLLIIDNSSKSPRLDADVLWKTLGFTPAESELAQALMEGNTVGDCASLRHASKQSMRNLLLSIMRKTDTHRQTQLVSLLTRLAIHAHT